MDDIREWLKGAQNYDQGVDLYMKYGRDATLRRVFSEPVSDFKKKKLVEAIRSLLSIKVSVVKKVAETKVLALERVAVADRKWPEELDPTLTALNNQWRPLFAELMNLSSRIYEVALAGQNDSAKKAEAGAMAHRILDLDELCDAIYSERDYYIEHNKLREEPKPMELVVDPIKIPMALANAQRYVRNYKTKISKDPTNVHAVQQLEKYEWAVAEYKKILKLQ